MGSSVQADSVRQYRLAGLSGWPAERPTVRTLAHAVAKCSGLGVADILGKGRRSDYVKARHVLTWLARRFTKSSAPVIAAALKRRDHYAVLYSIARVNLAIREARIPSPASDTPEAWAGLLWNADWPALERRDPMRV
jgi:chromosomal replication initiation ATPase DnaA